MNRMPIVIVMIVFAFSLHVEGTESGTIGGLQFKDWGTSFTMPAQWQRWPSEKENAAFSQALQSLNNVTLEEVLIHIAGWSAAEDACFLILTIKRERRGSALNLSNLMARLEYDDKKALEYGDATNINRLAVDKIGSLSCIVHDVTLRAGGRALDYNFISGSENFQFLWVFPDGSRFAEFKPAIDGILHTISIGAKQTSGGPVSPSNNK